MLKINYPIQFKDMMKLKKVKDKKTPWKLSKQGKMQLDDRIQIINK